MLQNQLQPAIDSLEPRLFLTSVRLTDPSWDVAFDSSRLPRGESAWHYQTVVAKSESDLEDELAILRTDGTVEGTSIIPTGIRGRSHIDEFQTFGDGFLAYVDLHNEEDHLLIFTESDGLSRLHLEPTATDLEILPISDGTALLASDEHFWLSDGTEAGTELVGERPDDHTLGWRNQSVVYQGDFYFFSDPFWGQPRLWKLDLESHDLEDIAQFERDDSPESLIVANNRLYVSIDATRSGEQTYQYDGGASALKYLGDGLLQLDTATTLNGDLITRIERKRFSADLVRVTNDGEIIELAGTVGEAGPWTELISYGPDVYFLKYAANDSQVWRTDGTSLGTSLSMGLDGSYSAFHSMGQVNDRHYVITHDSAARTSAVLLIDGNGARVAFLGGGVSETEHVVLASGELLFRAYTGRNSSEIWVTDDTAIGAHRVMSTQGESGGQSLVEIAGRGYFVSDGKVFGTDGTSEGTTDIGGQLRVKTPFSLYDDLFVSGDVLYFLNEDADHGSEFWYHNSKTGETALSRDVEPGNAGLGVWSTEQLGDRLLFWQRTEFPKRELWALGNDFDVPHVSFSDARVELNEGESLTGSDLHTLELTRSNSDGVSEVKIEFVSNSHGLANGDFAAAAMNVSFEDGEMSKRIPLPVLDDAFAEFTEEFEARLYSETNAAVDAGELARIKVFDNDRGGDANADGVVDFDDFRILASNFGEELDGQGASLGDFDFDNRVGFSDFLLLSASFGKSVTG